MSGNSKNIKRSAAADIIQPPLVPVGYDPVPTEQLAEASCNTKTVKSSKKKLWLIKLPQNFDPSALNGQEVILNGIQDLPPLNEETDQRFELQAIEHDSEQLSSFRAVLPSVEKECLLAGKPFTGQVNVLQNVIMPHVDIPKTSQQTQLREIPEELTVRWKPFGWKKPKGQIQGKNSKKKQQLDNKEVEESNTHLKNKNHKKQKRKKEKSEEVVTQEENGSSPVKKHKKKKKH